MFLMTVERQLNLNDRTLLLGKPQFDVIPKHITLRGKKVKIIGISSGVVLPFLSLEIEQIKDTVVGETISGIDTPSLHKTDN